MPVHPIKQTFQLNCIMNCYDQLNVFLLIDPIGQFGRISSQKIGAAWACKNFQFARRWQWRNLGPRRPPLCGGGGAVLRGQNFLEF